MKTCRIPLRAIAIVALTLGSTLPAFAADPLVAVYAKTRHGYARTLLPDNSYRPESYIFADGGRLTTNVNDQSIDRLSFAKVAGVVAASLKRQQYVNTSEANRADLLIFVSYGSTEGNDAGAYQNAMSSLSEDFRAMSRPADVGGDVSHGLWNGLSDPVVPSGENGLGLTDSGGVDSNLELRLQAAANMDASFNRIALANEVREQQNRTNARILGYEAVLDDTNFRRPYSNTARDLLGDVEESRYFVVLQAYDFQKLRTHQGKVLLWETRYSIPRRGVGLDEQLVTMTRFASQFCGQNVGRLIRRPLREGRVELGAPVVVPTSAK